MTKADVDVRVGRDAGSLLLDSIKGAHRRLLIVSPWLSPASAELVVQKQRRGVEVEIVTTNDSSPNHLRALGELIEIGKRTRRKRRLAVQAGGLMLAFAGILTFLMGLFEPNSALVAAGLVCAGAILFQLGRPRTERYWKPKVGRLTVYDAVAGPLIHAKVYVIDDKVAVGSANFTVTGLRRSVEGMVFLRGDGIADRVLAQLDSLKNEPLVEVPLSRVVLPTKK